MVDMSTITASLAAGTAIADIFKSVASGIAELQTAKDKKRQQEIAARLNGEIITLQNALIAAQAVQIAAHNLVVEMNQWNKEKTHYQMQVFQPGATIYTIKPEHQGSEPVHHICANCYSQNQKGFLQVTKKAFARTDYLCPRCQNSFYIDNL